MEAIQLVRPGCQTVVIAAIEMVEKLHKFFPDAVVKPAEPYEDEDVCLHDVWSVGRR